jgi:hypothetical protein
MEALITAESELDKGLRLERTGPCPKLCDASGGGSTLPGQPRIELKSSDLGPYLDREHLVPDLDQLAPKLWLVSSWHPFLGESSSSTIRCQPLAVHTSRHYIIKPFEGVPSSWQNILSSILYGPMIASLSNPYHVISYRMPSGNTCRRTRSCAKPQQAFCGRTPTSSVMRPISG